MAIRELHTAAVHVLHLERAADIDTETLRLRCGIHPIDAEATTSVAVESNFSSYGSYAFITLLWPNASFADASDIRFFIFKQQLVIIGDTLDHDIRAYLNTVDGHTSAAIDQLSGTGLWLDLLGTLVREHRFQPSRVRALHLDALASTVRQFGGWVREHDAVHVPSLVVVAHRIDMLSDHLRSSTAPSPEQRSTVTVPRMARGYAMAAIVMVIGVALTLSIQ
jgi:hypothetical protein